MTAERNEQLQLQKLALSALSDLTVPWFISKHVDRIGVPGHDIDLCLPAGGWELATSAVHSALQTEARWLAITCDHYPSVRLAFYCPLYDSALRQVLELDYADGINWKGASMISVSEAWDLTVINPDLGVRQSRPGLEAAITLTRGLTPHGLSSDIARRVCQLAGSDHDAFREAMKRIHGRRGSDLAIASLEAEGPRSRVALLALLTGFRRRGDRTTRTKYWIRRHVRPHQRLGRGLEAGAPDWSRRAARSHVIRT